MKRNIITLSLITLFVLFVGNSLVQAQKTYETEAEARKNAGQGVTFKAPDGYHTGPFAEFKGVTMVNLKAPAGLFVTYPNEDESIEDLKKRAIPAVVGMFIHDDEKVKTLDWETTDIPSHKGDVENAATLNETTDGKMTVQVAVYEREWNGLKFIYGYYAMKFNNGKKSKDFLDKKGQGVKAFEKFWKTFPTK
jgi:hypothetical protein